MKKLLMVCLAMQVSALSVAQADFLTMCDNCCNLPADKTRYVNWTNNKMFVDAGPIKGSVDFNSSLLLGNGGTTSVTTGGSNALSADPQYMEFENTPEWGVTIVSVRGIPVPTFTLTHWNVQSFGFLTLHDADVTPDQVEFRRRAQGWEVDPFRLPYPENCAADENKGKTLSGRRGDGLGEGLHPYEPPNVPIFDDWTVCGGGPSYTVIEDFKTVIVCGHAPGRGD